MTQRLFTMSARGLAVAFAFAWLPLPADADETAPPPDDADVAATTEVPQWSEPLQPLKPLQSRSEAERDRLHAGALYATGRTLFHRGELAEALRHYQRAWRWDPAANEILGDIVALAFSLERPDEAVRYALLAAEKGDSEALMLRRLALYVTETGNWAQAVKLYRRWLAHPDINVSPNDADRLLVLLEVGRLEFLNQNAAEASRALGAFQQAFLKLKPDSQLRRRLLTALGEDLNASWELCAMAHFEAEQFELAREALDQIELPLDEAGRIGYLQAEVALERGDPVAAWEFLREYLSAGFVEDGSEPYELLSRIFKQLNQPDAFYLELGKLREADPGNPALTLAMASELERRGEIDTAIGLLRGMVSSDQSPPEPLLASAVARLAELYGRQGNAEDLWDVLLTATDQLQSEAPLDTAINHIGDQAELVKALQEVEAQVQGVNSAPRAMMMARLLLAADELDSAQDYFVRANAFEQQHRVERTLGWGLAHFAAEHYERASEVFRKAVDDQLAEENDPLFHYYLSMSLELAGQTDEALRVARAAAEMRSDDVEFAAHVPWVLYHAQRREDAVQEYEAVLRRFDDKRDSEVREQLRDVRSSLSNLMAIDGNLEAAEEWLQQILDEFPEDVGAMNDLGYLWADAGKHLARAHEMIQAAVEAQPQNAAYRDSLGWVLFRLGEFEAARRELERAVELSAEQEGSDGQADAIILDHLGDACMSTGDVEEAVKYWQLAVDGLEKSEPQKAVETRQKIAEHGDTTEE